MSTAENSKRRFINVDFTMSYEEYDAGFTMPEYHLHNDYEIYILERGERTVTLASSPAMSTTSNEPHSVELCTTSGDVVLFERESPHKSRGTSAFSGICIHFSERFLKKYFTEISIVKLMDLFSLRMIHLPPQKVTELKAMTDAFVMDDDSNFLKLAKVFEMLMTAERAVQPHNRTMTTITSPITTAAHPTKKAQIFTYISENYAHITNLPELAETFEVSESYLYKIFQTEYAMSPKAYINRLRLQNICSRLKYSDATIRSIAENFGFESYEHFCRLFKKEMGCTPSAYRKSQSSQ